MASTVATEGYSLMMCLEHPIEMPKYPNTECSLEENVKWHENKPCYKSAEIGNKSTNYD